MCSQYTLCFATDRQLMLLSGMSEKRKRDIVLESNIPLSLLITMFKSCIGIFCFNLFCWNTKMWLKLLPETVNGFCAFTLPSLLAPCTSFTKQLCYWGSVVLWDCVWPADSIGNCAGESGQQIGLQRMDGISRAMKRRRRRRPLQTEGQLLLSIWQKDREMC